ncbi:MAG: DNA-binding LytR/AlgR family response regulator [Cyclobacteriaceae bacterium]|jgi:DNA-binding LytR/AlgR family response regulator
MVVDDDELSRLMIKKYVEKTDFLELTHELSSGIEASNVLMQPDSPDVDIIFLDIEMPEMTGIELLESLTSDYQVIMITSAEKYALNAFEQDVTDFLVKPFSYGRFLKAAVKANEVLENIKKKAESFSELYVKSDSRVRKIVLSEVMFIEAMADYVIFNTTKGKHIVHHTMKGIEKKLPESLFGRVHRSYIVNFNRIEYFEDMNCVIKEKFIPVGVSYRERVFGRLNML